MTLFIFDYIPRCIFIAYLAFLGVPADGHEPAVTQEFSGLDFCQQKFSQNQSNESLLALTPTMKEELKQYFQSPYYRDDFPVTVGPDFLSADETLVPRATIFTNESNLIVEDIQRELMTTRDNHGRLIQVVDSQRILTPHETNLIASRIQYLLLRLFIAGRTPHYVYNAQQLKREISGYSDLLYRFNTRLIFTAMNGTKYSHSLSRLELAEDTLHRVTLRFNPWLGNQFSTYALNCLKYIFRDKSAGKQPSLVQVGRSDFFQGIPDKSTFPEIDEVGVVKPSERIIDILIALNEKPSVVAIIADYFGLNPGHTSYTVSEIADRTGYTPQNVSLVLRNGLMRIRHKLCSTSEIVRIAEEFNCDVETLQEGVDTPLPHLAKLAR